MTALELLTAFLVQLRRDLVTRSNLRLTPQEALETLIAVPANANSNQRFLTLEAVRTLTHPHDADMPPPP